MIKHKNATIIKKVSHLSLDKIVRTCYNVNSYIIIFCEKIVDKIKFGLNPIKSLEMLDFFAFIW